MEITGVVICLSSRDITCYADMAAKHIHPNTLHFELCMLCVLKGATLSFLLEILQGPKIPRKMVTQHHGFPEFLSLAGCS